MDDQLVIDSSGAWVRKTAQLIAEKPLLSAVHFRDQPHAADHSMDFISDEQQNKIFQQGLAMQGIDKIAQGIQAGPKAFVENV